MAQLDNHFSMPEPGLWPIAIYKDRYSGAYSGALWLAVSGFRSLYESDAYANETTCAAFWGSSKESSRIGRGQTPEKAVLSLYGKWLQQARTGIFCWDVSYHQESLSCGDVEAYTGKNLKFLSSNQPQPGE